MIDMRWPWQPPGDEKEMQEIAEQLIEHLEERAASLQQRAARVSDYGRTHNA